MKTAALNPILRQFGLGLAIFAVVLAASLPLAFVDEGLALGAAVGVASVMIALQARRLRIAMMIATLLAVLGAFGTAHSIHLAMGTAPTPRLGQLAPAAGPFGYGAAATILNERAAAAPAAVVMPTRAEIVRADGTRTALPLPAGWALPAVLFLFWALGYGLVAANRALIRWFGRALGPAA